MSELSDVYSNEDSVVLHIMLARGMLQMMERYLLAAASVSHLDLSVIKVCCFVPVHCINPFAVGDEEDSSWKVESAMSMTSNNRHLQRQL